MSVRRKKLGDNAQATQIDPAPFLLDAARTAWVSPYLSIRKKENSKIFKPSNSSLGMSSTRSSFTHVQEDSEVAFKIGGCAIPHETVPYFNPPPGCALSVPASKAELVDGWLCDPKHPRNWTTSKKWCSAAIVSLYMFVSPLSSSIMAPGLSEIRARYGIESQTVLSMTLSIFLLSFGIGPLILGPLSEMYGRKWVLHVGNLCSIIFHLGCAFAPSTEALLAFRFLAGFSGGAPSACGGAVISDLFAERERASAMAVYSLGPLIGPVVGPIAGGFIAETAGIKYVYFTLAGVTTLASLIGIPFLRETYAPLLKLRVMSLCPLDPEKVPRGAEGINPPCGKLHHLWINFSRPLMLLSHSFICFILSLYMAFMYGIYYLFFTTLNGFFTATYGFSTGITGLMYCGLGAGFILATTFGAKFSNALYTGLAEKNGGVGEPEMRIPPIFIGSIFVPIGLFWYGWSAQAKIHWIMPVIGSGLFGFGMMTTFLPIQLYLVDAFKYAASALSAAFLFRSLLGFSFPLFGNEMFAALGFGGGNSLLGGLATILGIPL
ncbi:major facilitator superfamily domain-containing protein [Mycena alexandri]|uniref:Major facilitator superfamily domain-containing protein n=1 Tax=Mycena alexandri TaxID=1745969 RepID=A0AAD6X2W1_9AGAR|nr:major facilitator superfamily domain-containing protein [Mycena alexandri]